MKLLYFFMINIVLLYLPSYGWSSNNPKSNYNQNNPNQTFQQWFTGPFFVPSPISMPPKHPSFNPYFGIAYNYGEFDKSWKFKKASNRMLSLQYGAYGMVGITEKLGIDFIFQTTSSYCRKQTFTYPNDFFLRIGYQILTSQPESKKFSPNVRLIFQEIFPTGKYENLNPHKLKTDCTGNGSYQSGLYIAMANLFFANSRHSLNLYFAQGFIIPSNVKVHKFNYYGGNNNTQGRVSPGFIISTYFSGEVELSKHLSFAWDFNFQENLRGSYSSNLKDQSLIDVNQSVLFLFSPELEIVFNKNIALLIAPWVTLGGQNTFAYNGSFIELVCIF